MRKLYTNGLIGLFFLFTTSLFAQSSSDLALSSENTSDIAILKVSTSQNLTGGYTLELQNNACGIDDSKLLEKSVFYKSNDPALAANFSKTGNTYTFNTPFTTGTLAAKWFRWRVVLNNGEKTAWQCFSWSSYCAKHLNPDGSCKNK